MSTLLHRNRNSQALSRSIVYMILVAIPAIAVKGQGAGSPFQSAPVTAEVTELTLVEVREQAEGVFLVRAMAAEHPLPAAPQPLPTGCPPQRSQRITVPLSGTPGSVRITASPAAAAGTISLVTAGIFRGLTLAAIEYISSTDYSTATGGAHTLEFEILLDPLTGDSQPKLSPATLRVLSQLTGIPLASLAADYSWYERDHLLVIAPDSLAAALAPLVSWKRRTGLEVTIIPLSVSGGTADSIKSFLVQAYETWERPPTFVLLAGDTGQIPAWLGQHSPDPTAPGSYPTDLYYGTLDGPDDLIPDLFIGRLPARSRDELVAMVSKLLTYELTPTDQLDWRSRAVFVASGEENLHQLVENTHRYAISSYLAPAGLQVDSIWAYSGGNTSDIVSALNSGVNLLCYSGHGTAELWWDSHTAIYFGRPQIDNLANAPAFPLVLSFGCEAGIYGADDLSLGEAFVKAANRGAAAFWGASHPTFWYEDDYLERRFFDGLFSGRLLTVGEMVLTALMEVWLRGYPTADYYFEIYNLLGDPSLAFGFGPLDTLAIAFQDTLPAGVTALTLEVSDSQGPLPVGWASVAYDTVVSQSSVSNGVAQFRFDPPLASGGAALVTVTALGHVPFQGSLVIIPAPTILVDPDSIVIDQADTITVTVTGLPPGRAFGNLIQVNGLGVPTDLTAVTDSTGTVVLAFTPLFGETLRLTVSDSSGALLAEATLPVTGGLELPNQSQVAGSILLGTTGFLVPGFSGEVTWSAVTAGTAIYLQGAGIDTSTTDTLVVLKPAFEGIIRAALASPGYTLAIYSIPVHPATGGWEGLVLTAGTGQPLANQQLDIASLAGQPPLTYAMTTEDSGAFHLPDELPVGYYRYHLSRFGYQSLDDTLLIRHGTNSDTLVLTPLETASVTGTITSAGAPLAGAVIWARGRDLRDTTATDGVFTLSGIVPGSVRFTIYHPGYVLLDSVLALAAAESLTALEFPLVPGPALWRFTFEDDDEGFNLAGDWQHGSPGIGLHRRGPAGAHQGQQLVATVLDGDFRAYSDSRLVTPLLHLDGFEHATLSFYHYYQLGLQPGFDGGNLKVSTDNGQSWEMIQPVGGYPVEAMNSGSILVTQPAFSGTQGRWERVQVSLDDYIDWTAGIRLRFHLGSTGQEQDDGWYIDDITLLNDPPQALAEAGMPLPTHFLLHQNYPNPFNPATTILYELPEADRVELQVYNIRGQLVGTLVNSWQPAGAYEIHFDATHLSSGLYLYRLRTSRFTRLRKMMVLK